MDLDIKAKGTRSSYALREIGGASGLWRNDKKINFTESKQNTPKNAQMGYSQLGTQWMSWSNLSPTLSSTAYFDVLKYNSSSSSKTMIFLDGSLVAAIIFKGTWLISCLDKEPGNRLTKLWVRLKSIQRVDHADWYLRKTNESNYHWVPGLGCTAACYPIAYAWNKLHLGTLLKSCFGSNNSKPCRF